jgi:membrane-associated protease RseP (regulator of RpoE activity)
MRVFALILLLVLGACDSTEEQLRLATVDAEEGLGMSLRELPQATLNAIGLGYGLAVIRLGAAAEQAGLRLGDVVYGVNQTRIRNLQDFSRALAQPAPGAVGLLVRRGKTDLYVPLQVGGGRAPEGAPADGSRLPLRQPTDTLLRT